MYRAGDLGHVTAVDSGACSNLGGSLAQAKDLAAATPNLDMPQTSVICLRDITPSTPVTPAFTDVCLAKPSQLAATHQQHMRSACWCLRQVQPDMMVSMQQTVLHYLSIISAGQCWTLLHKQLMHTQQLLHT
jgi:hypothetical protein